MKTRILLLALCAAISAPLAAQDLTISDIARETGLSEQQVRMVLGARSGHAEYRVRYDRVERQLREALGNQTVDDLVAGKKVRLDKGPDTTKIASATTKPLP